jgi:hypothetical protein
MRLYKAPVITRAATLRNAEKAAAQQPNAGTVQPCPLKIVNQRLLAWHLSELGGGLHWPRERPAHVIDAYAQLVKASGAGVVALTGLSESTGPLAIRKGSGRDSYLVPAPAIRDVGAKEVDRIVAALGRVDGAGGWKAATFRDDKDQIVYLGGATTCFLHKTTGGWERLGLDLVEGPAVEALGVPARYLCGRWKAPGLAGHSAELALLAPFGSFAPPEKQHTPTAPLPASAALALSANGDLSARLSAFSTFCNGVGAEYCRMPDRGTILRQPFWRRLSATNARLLEDFSAVDPADVRLQDKAMHTEAVAAPTHTDALDKIEGVLADVFLVRNPATPTYTLDNLRDVDLMLALGLPLPAPPDDPVAPPRWEKGALAAAFEKHKAAAHRQDGGKPDDDPANAIALGWEFLSLLSDHWPVAADLHMPAAE